MHKAIRYIGSKQKVLPFLEDNLFINLKEGDSFFDGFVGSGIVSQYVSEKHKNIKLSGGDLSLYSQILFDILNIGREFINFEEILNIIKEFEAEDLVGGDIFNEFSQYGVPTSYIESRNFFHEKSGKTIDSYKKFIAKKLADKKITKSQEKILLYFILSYACKVANTTSVFGAFLKSEAKHKPFNSVFVEKILNDLKEIKELKNSADFYLGDIVENLKVIPKQAVIYLDPPYSTRRYESNYHILSYIVDMGFSSEELKNGSKTGQPKTMGENPFGKKKGTEVVFAEMIKEGVNKSDLLGISYNTDGIIKQVWMEDFCKKNGYVLDTRKLEYKRFKSKNEVKNITELEEILWLIKKQ